MPFLKLQSKDGEIFKVDIQAAKCSNLLKVMLEGPNIEKDYDEVVPVPNVNATTLRKVLEWANYHKYDPPMEDDNRPVHICDWDREFLRVDKEILMELILAANYLVIKGLLDVTCVAVVDMIKETKPGRTRLMRNVFNIDDGFAAKEEARTSHRCREFEKEE